MNSVAAQFKVRKISELQHLAKATSADAAGSLDWVTVGVLVRKKTTKNTDKGSTFHVWEVSDLRPNNGRHGTRVRRLWGRCKR